MTDHDDDDAVSSSDVMLMSVSSTPGECNRIQSIKDGSGGVEVCGEIVVVDTSGNLSAVVIVIIADGEFRLFQRTRTRRSSNVTEMTISRHKTSSSACQLQGGDRRAGGWMDALCQ